MKVKNFDCIDNCCYREFEGCYENCPLFGDCDYCKHVSEKDSNCENCIYNSADKSKGVLK